MILSAHLLCCEPKSGRPSFFFFFLNGHTWMEIESINSVTEGKLRGRQIFWPAESTFM